MAHGLSSCGSWALERRLSSCGTQAQSLHSMWDLPGPGLEHVSPALAGGFSSTAPPGKSDALFFIYTIFLNLKLTEKLEVKLKKEQKTFCVLNYLSCQLDVSSPSNIDTLRYIPLTNKDILLQNHNSHNQGIK